ncbi:MAG: glycosyltransferase, partial [Gammaproteobacteria bacterium]|nr:glycosyltransferase [Gammaproteobacteria bacterium]
MSKRISFLIVTWNSWRDLKRCVESILPNLEFDDELVVIDNGSSDDTVEKIEQSFGERVRLHCNEVNLGLPPAVNQGVAQTLGDYIMLLDVDTEIQSDAPALLFEYMQQHPEAALIAPRILTPEGKDEGTARNLPSVMSGLFGRQSALTR